MHNCILARSLAAVMCKFLWPNAPVVGVEKKFSHLAGVTTEYETKIFCMHRGKTIPKLSEIISGFKICTLNSCAPNTYIKLVNTYMM
jgi:hypothetical protein